MTIPYCKELPAHIDRAVVRECAEAWRHEFDTNLDLRVRKSKATSARYSAEREITAYLQRSGYKEGDAACVHHDGGVTMMSLEKSPHHYSSGLELKIAAVKNMTGDDRDAASELGKLASAWLAAKRAEEVLEVEDNGFTGRLGAIEDRLKKHVISALPHSFEESIFFDYLHRDGWSFFVSVFKSYGYGDWKIAVRFSTHLLRDEDLPTAGKSRHAQ